jgi:glyoxylase-like metal-dependent hydrolase (beta-lactamase superfamily II)
MAYFKVFPIANKTWYIKEPLGVGCFLFEGEECALLMDTCNGYRDIRKTLARLSSRPLTVLNSHGHADHTGGNNQFKEVTIHKDDLPMLAPEYLQTQHDLLFGYAKAHYPLLRPLLWWLERAKHETFETEARPFEGGKTFELGRRALRVLPCPGHSPGSIVLADEYSKTLYAADAVNPGLFLFFEGSPKMKEYAGEIRKLCDLSGLEEIRISHSEKPLPFSFVAYYADFLERATLEKSRLTDIPNGGKPVYKYSESGLTFDLPEIAVHFTKEQL